MTIEEVVNVSFSFCFASENPSKYVVPNETHWTFFLMAVLTVGNLINGAYIKKEGPLAFNRRNCIFVRFFNCLRRADAALDLSLREGPLDGCSQRFMSGMIHLFLGRFLLADLRKSVAEGAPALPGLRMRSPLPALMRARLALMLAHRPGFLAMNETAHAVDCQAT